MHLHTAYIGTLFVTQLIVPVFVQNIQSRHHRPFPKTCDRHGRCSAKEGYIEEADQEDDYRSDKNKPPILTRDDWPTRPHVSDIDIEKDTLTSGGGRNTGGGYNSKPAVDRDNLKPDRHSVDGGYNTKPVGSRDEDTKSGVRPGIDGYVSKPPNERDGVLKPVKPDGGRGGYDDVYNPKPIDRDDVNKGRPVDDSYNPKSVDASDEIKPVRSGGGGGYGGGYNPKPLDRDDNIKPIRSSGGGGYGGSYNPKPVNKDDVIKPVRPGGSGGYGGSYNPKPNRRDDDIKPVRPGGGYGGGYNPKPVYDDDYIEPVRPSGGGEYGGGYNPKPVDRDGYGGGSYPKHDEDDYKIKPARGGDEYSDDGSKPPKKDLGGYDIPKDDYYNDDYKDGDIRDDEYGNDGKPPLPLVDGNCICVPYYQCTDGHIVTDGAGIIDARKKPDMDGELPLDGKFKPPSCGPFHVCCNTPETSTVKPYEHRCGVRNPSGINSRILSPSNKGEADFGEWPWQAAVLKSEGKVNIFQCGGVLIDKYHVITVAHCVYHLYKFNEYPLKVRLGEWDTQKTTEFLAHEDYRVSKIIVHPEFRNASLWNDIAVLRLQDPVLFAPHIDTVCLPQYDEMFDGQNCVVTGWGKDAYKGGTFSNVMKEVALQVIDNYKCEEMLRKTRLGRFFQLHEGFMCAGGEYGLDSCKGDGGGPLVCYRKDKSYALAGIVSWGIDCGQPGVPGVYVKIQKYLEWVSKTTGVALQDYWPK